MKDIDQRIEDHLRYAVAAMREVTTDPLELRVHLTERLEDIINERT